MFYVQDIEALGGVFIREKLIKKTYSYEIIECVLYVMGEKFKVVLKEYRKGKGIVIAVIENEKEQSLKQMRKLQEIMERYDDSENVPIAYYRRQRRMIETKVSMLKGINFFVLLQSINKLWMCYCQGQILTQTGIRAIITSLVGVMLVFLIHHIGQCYIRGL